MINLPTTVLAADKSIRFCGIIDKLGQLLFTKYRDDTIEPVLSDEENDRYALLTTMRRRLNLPWRQKIGKTHYFLMRSERLVQATIPLTPEHLMLVYFDSDGMNRNYDKIILERILPLVQKYVEEKDVF